MTTAAEFEQLWDQASAHWRAAEMVRNAAMDVTVRIIARVIRHHYPDAATLVLRPDPDNWKGWEAGEVRDAAGRILSDLDMDGQDLWDLTGPDHSTNDVSSLVGDLEVGMDWETFAPRNSDPTDDRRFLDLGAVLAS